MRLLVITQKVNKNDSNLGFFHEWLLRLAARVEHLYVICLEKGTSDLPANVTVLSLGKEQMSPSARFFRKLLYWWRFKKFIRQYQNHYDAVFVHMNPEYVVFGGRFWHAHGKKILLWYTHKSVNWWLRRAEKLVDKIFTASRESFRLPSKKVEVVGHGIPVEFFSLFTTHGPLPPDLWLLWVGRIAPVKDLETVIKAVGELKKNEIVPPVRFSIVGSPITLEGVSYKKRLEELACQFVYEDSSPAVGFRSERTYKEMPDIYHQNQIFMDTSRTGSIDKVVLEALATGRIVVTSSQAYGEAERLGLIYTFPEGNHQELAKTIEKIYKSGILKQLPNQRAMEYVKRNHNLDTLVDKIINYFAV